MYVNLDFSRIKRTLPDHNSNTTLICETTRIVSIALVDEISPDSIIISVLLLPFSQELLFYDHLVQSFLEWLLYFY